MARKKEETFERFSVSISSTMRRNVHQSNILIQGKKNLDLMGMRLFLMALSTVNPHFSVKDRYYDKDFKDSFISSKVLKDRLGGTKYLAMLPKACKRLEQSTITVDSKFLDHETIYTLFHHFEYKPWEGIYFRFNNRLRPYILDLLDANGFTSIRLEHILKLTSVYAIRLLELLLQYQNLSRFKQTHEIERTLTIEQLRRMLNVPETAYKGRVDNLKRQVVRLPVKEINARTPYYLHFRTLKRGNKVVAFRFFMDCSKAYERPEKKIYFSNQAIERLRGLGFSDLVARLIYKKCKNGTDCQSRIINAERLFRHQEKNIRNRLGFLRAAIENDWNDYYLSKNETIRKHIFDPQEDKEYEILLDGNELDPIQLKPKKKSSKRKKPQPRKVPVANPYSRVSISMSRPLYPKTPPWVKNNSDDQNISAEDYQEGSFSHNFIAVEKEKEKEKKKKENQNIQEGYYDAEQDRYFVVYPDTPEFSFNRRFPPIDYADPDVEKLVNKRFDQIRKIPGISTEEIISAIISETKFARKHQGRAIAAKKAIQEERKSPYYFDDLPILPSSPPPLTKKEQEERLQHPEKLHWPPPPDKNPKEGYYDVEQDKYIVVYPDTPEFRLNRRFPPINYADPDFENLIDKRIAEIVSINHVTDLEKHVALLNEFKFGQMHHDKAMAEKKEALARLNATGNQPSATPGNQPSATPDSQPSATPGSQLSATPDSQPSATPDNQPSATVNQDPNMGYYDVEQDKYIVVYPDTPKFRINRRFPIIDYLDPNAEKLVNERLDEIRALTDITNYEKYVTLTNEVSFAHAHHNKAIAEKKEALARLNATGNQQSPTLDNQLVQDTQDTLNVADNRPSATPDSQQPATAIQTAQNTDDDNFVDTRFYINRRFPIIDYTGDNWKTLLGERSDQIKVLEDVPIEDIGIALHFEGAFAVDQRNAAKNAQNDFDDTQGTVITEFPNKTKYFINRLFTPNDYTGDNWEQLLNERFNQIKKISFLNIDKKGQAINHESAFALAQIKAARAAKKAPQDTSNATDNQQTKNNKQNTQKNSSTGANLGDILQDNLKKIIARQGTGATNNDNQPPINDDPSDTRYHVNRRFPPNDYTGPDWEELLYRRFADINRLTDITERELIDAKRFEEDLAYEQHEKAEAARKKRKQQESTNSTPQSSATVNQPATTVNKNTVDTRYHVNRRFPPNDYTGPDWEELLYRRFADINRLTDITERELIDAKRFEEDLAYEQHEKAEAARKKRKQQESTNSTPQSSATVNQPAPTVNQPAPTVNQTAPIVNQPAPIVNQPAPIVNQPAPIVNQPASTVIQPASTVIQPANAMFDINFPNTPKYRVNRLFTPNNYTGPDWRILLNERLELINDLTEIPEDERIAAQQYEAAMAMDQIKASLTAKENLSNMQQMTLNPIKQVINKIDPEEIETSILYTIADELRGLEEAYESSGKDRAIFLKIDKLQRKFIAECKRLARREDLDDLFRLDSRITNIWKETFEKMDKFLYDSYYIPTERTDGINSLVLDTLALTAKDGKVPKRIDRIYITNDPRSVPPRFIRVKGTLISDRSLKDHFERLHQLKTREEKERLYEFTHIPLNELIVLYIKDFDDLP